MPSLILSGEDLSVTRVSERLNIVRRIQDERGEHFETHQVPLFDIDRVVILGHPAVSMPALTCLMDRGIPCHFLTRHGRWRGSFTPDNNLNASRRIRQYEQGTDPDFALRVARSLVHAKIRNSRRVLQRLAANRKAAEGPEYEQTMLDLQEYAEMALEGDTVDIVRGAEGIAAALYFQRLADYFPDNIPLSSSPTRTRSSPTASAEPA